MRGHASTAGDAAQIRWSVLGGLIAGVFALAVMIVSQEALPRYTIALVGGALLTAAMVMLRNLRLICLYGLLLMAPLALRHSFLEYPHLGGASAMFVEAVDPFMLMLLYFQVRERVWGYRSGYRFPRPLILWSGMIALGIGSVVFLHYLRLSAANEVVRMLKLLLLMAVIVNEVRTVPQFRHVVIAIALGVILQSAVGVLEYVRGGQLGLSILGEATDEDIKTLSDASFVDARESGVIAYRVSGLLGHANLLAAYLALFLPVSIALILTTFARRVKLLLAVTLLLGLPALVLTLSRAGWIDFSVAFAMVMVLGTMNTFSRGRFNVARVIVIVVTIAVASAMSPLIMRRLFETDPSAVQYRLKWLETAKAMIMDHPVLGTGLNTYVFAQLPYAEQKTPIEMTREYGKFWPAVHNTWALTWSEQGTVGFILFVWIHLSVLWVAIRNLSIRDPFMHALSLGLFAGIVGVMLDGMASFYLRVEAPARTFWIAVALVLAIGYWRRANEEAKPLADPLPVSNPPQGGARVVSGRWLPNRTSALR